MKLTDLPSSYQDQVRRQLAQSSSSTSMLSLVKVGNCAKPHDPRTDKVARRPKVSSRPPVKAGCKRQMNDNERLYNNKHLGGKGMFEAVTLKLPGGTMYTPDFLTWDENGRMTAHEVKGSYKLQSHGAAAVRFRECVAAFPAIVFVWAAQEYNEYNIETFNERMVHD